jgi:putative ABC transport system ATP-binding protein|tara:strand:+ start:575 stop:1273 length:699 start_codon:yes stop_codon:yes gene_type:complete
MSLKPLLHLENISKSYKLGNTKTQVLDNVNASFYPGCFSVIAGSSGSGKSTLLNLLGCLDKPDEGEYWLENKKINYSNKKEMSNTRMRNFGFIFQSFNLIPVLTAKENVELPMYLQQFSKKGIRKQSEEILKIVGLGGKTENKPSELSGGEQQRVAIARAIVSKPKVVFADEPTANLDRKNAEKIVALMKNLNEEHGVSFIFASHDDIVINAAKQLYDIENGELKQRVLASV